MRVEFGGTDVHVHCFNREKLRPLSLWCMFVVLAYILKARHLQKGGTLYKSIHIHHLLL